jgi:hypothetical protein
MLLAGRAVALLPIYLEQGLLAHAVCRMGAGAQGAAGRPEDAVAAVAKVVTSWTSEAEPGPHAAAARRFATKYASHDPSAANQQVLDELDAMLRSNAGFPG